jgi:hypothetical protein
MSPGRALGRYGDQRHSDPTAESHSVVDIFGAAIMGGGDAPCDHLTAAISREKGDLVHTDIYDRDPKNFENNCNKFVQQRLPKEP